MFVYTGPTLVGADHAPSKGSGEAPKALKVKIKIQSSEITTGMFVSALDRPWLETSFLFQGFKVRDEQELTQLKAQCEHVFIDVEQSDREIVPQLLLLSTRNTENKAPASQLNTVTFKSHAIDSRSFKKHLRQCKTTYDTTKTYIDQVLEDVRLGKTIDVKSARTLVNDMAQKVVAEPSALVWLTHLKSRDEYTSQHCVNVCILALTFARHLGLEQEALNIVGLGALLHDIGKLRVPLEVLNKPGRLTEEEFKLMKSHPVHGHALLCREKDLDKHVLDIVLFHHERANGSGYPRGLNSEQLHHYTKIVAVADVYDAITSDRVYHDGDAPHLALKSMYQWAPDHFERNMIEAFIQCIGIYPIGSIVQLNTQQVGVVVQFDETHHLRPVVLLLVDSQGQRYARSRMINLGSTAWEKAGHPYTIERILAPGAYGIDVTQVIRRQIEDTKSE